MTCVRGVQEAADLRQHKQQADTRVQELQASVQAAGARTQQLSAQLAALEGRAAQAARETEAQKGEAAQHGQELEQRAAAAEKRALHLQAQVKAAEDAAKRSAEEAAVLKSHVQVCVFASLCARARIALLLLTTWRRGAQAAGDAEGKLQVLEADLKAAQAGKVRDARRCWQPDASERHRSSPEACCRRPGGGRAGAGHSAGHVCRDAPRVRVPAGRAAQGQSGAGGREGPRQGGRARAGQGPVGRRRRTKGAPAPAPAPAPVPVKGLRLVRGGHVAVRAQAEAGLRKAVERAEAAAAAAKAHADSFHDDAHRNWLPHWLDERINTVATWTACLQPAASCLPASGASPGPPRSQLSSDQARAPHARMR
jgi:hypothetical protein